MKISDKKLFKLDLILTILPFLVFFILKLTQVIDWSWWFITMPLWIGTAIIIIFLGIVLIIGFITTIIVLSVVGIRTLFDL